MWGPTASPSKVNDGLVDSNVATVSIAVTTPDKPPAAKPDTATVLATQSSITIDVLANDTDPDHDPLTITGTTQGTYGTTTIVLAGAKQQIQYTVAAARPKKGTKDTFIYTISDGRGGTATGTVTVTYK